MAQGIDIIPDIIDITATYETSTHILRVYTLLKNFGMAGNIFIELYDDTNQLLASKGVCIGKVRSHSQYITIIKSLISYNNITNITIKIFDCIEDVCGTTYTKDILKLSKNIVVYPYDASLPSNPRNIIVEPSIYGFFFKMTSDPFVIKVNSLQLDGKYATMMNITHFYATNEGINGFYHQSILPNVPTELFVSTISKSGIESNKERFIGTPIDPVWIRSDEYAKQDISKYAFGIGLGTLLTYITIKK